MRVSQYTAPAAEPIHLTEAKIHLRLAVDAADAVANASHHDPVLARVIAGARMQAEAFQWRALVLQIFDLFLDCWPDGNELEIPIPPLRSVDFIKHTDSTGAVNTMSASDYDVDTEGTPGRVVLGYGISWPVAELGTKNPIHIRFRAGYVVPFTAEATANVLTATNHTFIDGNKVRLSVSGGSLPTSLVEKKDYFARDVSGDTLKLAATDGGSAIDFTTVGSGAMFIGEIPSSTITGMLLSITDRFDNRHDNEVAIRHWLSMDSVRGF